MQNIEMKDAFGTGLKVIGYDGAYKYLNVTLKLIPSSDEDDMIVLREDDAKRLVEYLKDFYGFK